MIEEKVRQLIEGVIKENNYILDEVLYVKEDGNWFLRIVIDKSSPISIDDCVYVSNLINPILDKADIINGSYIVDVYSKGKECE